MARDPGQLVLALGLARAALDCLPEGEAGSAGAHLHAAVAMLERLVPPPARLDPNTAVLIAGVPLDHQTG